VTVGNRVFSGEGAPEEVAKALTFTILSWRDDQTIQPCGWFRGFEILSKGKSGGLGLLQEDERVPELFIRGRVTYSANLNPTNPVGTVQSIEHTLRSLDKLAAKQQGRVARAEKELVDYQAQADRPSQCGRGSGTDQSRRCRASRCAGESDHICGGLYDCA